MMILGGVLAATVVLAAAVFIWAISLPSEASATRSAQIVASPDDVYALVTDIAGQGTWRSDIGRVETDAEGNTWTEFTTQGLEIRFRQERKEPGLYVISYTSPQGFNGDWQGRFTAAAGGTTVDITETVRTTGLVPRVMNRLFAPPGAHIDLYLADLIKHFEDGS